MNNIELKYILVSLLSLKAQMNINGPALINQFLRERLKFFWLK